MILANFTELSVLEEKIRIRNFRLLTNYKKTETSVIDVSKIENSYRLFATGLGSFFVFLTLLCRIIESNSLYVLCLSSLS